MNYTVRISEVALSQLEEISDRRIRQDIFDRIKELSNDPDEQGKPLKNELAGLRSVRVANQRYRVIYDVERELVTVVVVAVGIRREGDKSDIYRKAAVLVRTHYRNANNRRRR